MHGGVRGRVLGAHRGRRVNEPGGALHGDLSKAGELLLRLLLRLPLLRQLGQALAELLLRLRVAQQRHPSARPRALLAGRGRPLRHHLDLGLGLVGAQRLGLRVLLHLLQEIPILQQVRRHQRDLTGAGDLRGLGLGSALLPLLELLLEPCHFARRLVELLAQLANPRPQHRRRRRPSAGVRGGGRSGRDAGAGRREPRGGRGGGGGLIEAARLLGGGDDLQHLLHEDSTLMLGDQPLGGKHMLQRRQLLPPVLLTLFLGLLGQHAALLGCKRPLLVVVGVFCPLLAVIFAAASHGSNTWTVLVLEKRPRRSDARGLALFYTPG